MDPVENVRATAQELLSFAEEQEVDVGPFCTDGHFEKDQRWVFFWRKDELPYSGPAGEKEGTLHYNMQGVISVLPNKLKESAGAFRGAWTEAGTFENVEQAFALLKAWLLDRKEVDELPSRSVRRYGI
ncbi:MAG TPA: hypothetical protein VMF69_14255 [Gemmataceae bacterium]|nr:hypothetical protein [Gemmataceae bacterium]